MNDDLVQAAKAASELEPAIEAFAEATGALEPLRESTGWLGDVIRVRRETHLAKVLMKAAEKIRASGLPPHAIRDKLLRAVVEDGSMEDDESMQERWANLLANAATSDAGPIKIAYAKILSELEPDEARLLDRFWDRTPDSEMNPFVTFGYDDTQDLAVIAELDNLSRLGVLRWVRSMAQTMDGPVSDEGASLDGVQLTELGWEFVRACREPSSSVPS